MKAPCEDYHFIGIGGIGMSGLAKILLEKGCRVSGSDKKNNALISELKRLGAHITEEQDGNTINQEQIIIYSTDIKENNPELQRARSLCSKVWHRADLLSELMRGYECFLVAGSHGKTTTSSMLVWTLMVASEKPSFAVGGIIHDLGTNAAFSKSPFFVAEADESDGSFLKFPCSRAIVTSTEEDHLDYWKNAHELKKGYLEFMQKVEDSRKLFVCGEDPFLKGFQDRAMTYGFSPDDMLVIDRFKQETHHTECRFTYGQFSSRLIKLKLMGRHNVLNAAAVFGLCLELGLDSEKICQGLETFTGTKRRLEKKGTLHNIDFYDDYAHHPTEIKVTLNALKMANPGRRLVAIFQPHRYTRLRDQFESFCRCFHEADYCIVTDLYSAGEKPIEGISSYHLYEKMKPLYPHIKYVSKLDLISSCSEIVKEGDIVVTLGAGDITECCLKLMKHLR